MWRDLLLFLPLAVLTNTAVPAPFEAVLFYFAARQTINTACWFALAGSLCAGLAGVIDAKFLSSLLRRVPARYRSWIPQCAGKTFYAIAFVFALLPVPFSVVRIMLARHRPNAAAYGLVIALGRLPRYMLTLYVYQSLALPSWVSAVVVLIAAVYGGCMIRPKPVANLRARANGGRVLKLRVESPISADSLPISRNY